MHVAQPQSPRVALRLRAATLRSISPGTIFHLSSVCAVFASLGSAFYAYLQSFKAFGPAKHELQVLWPQQTEEMHGHASKTISSATRAISKSD